jgi:hypothetical protein
MGHPETTRPFAMNHQGWATRFWMGPTAILQPIWLHTYGGISGGLLTPDGDLPEGLSESADDDGGFAVAEALDGEVGSLVGVVGGVPEADHDAIVGQVQADALADGAGLGEGEGGQGRDEDHGVGFVGERFENLSGDGAAGKVDGLVVGALHDLDEHVGGELVGLIAGGDADDGEVGLPVGA